MDVKRDLSFSFEIPFPRQNDISGAKYTVGVHRLQQRELMDNVNTSVFGVETQAPGLPWSTEGSHPVQCRERLSGVLLGPLESQFVSGAAGSGSKDATTCGAFGITLL